jgi:hypothetical protein
VTEHLLPADGRPPRRCCGDCKAEPLIGGMKSVIETSRTIAQVAGELEIVELTLRNGSLPNSR